MYFMIQVANNLVDSEDDVIVVESPRYVIEI